MTLSDNETRRVCALKPQHTSRVSHIPRTRLLARRRSSCTIVSRSCRAGRVLDKTICVSVGRARRPDVPERVPVNVRW